MDKSTENAGGTEELLIDTRDLPDILLIDKTGTSQSSPPPNSQHLPELLKTSRNTGASPKVKQPKENVPNNSKWKPPLLGPLPPDFLRITTDGRTDYDLPDEQFALMLQNEEFMNELRWNQEFMNALEKEQQEKGRDVDDAAFKERLRHMGKMSRKKFLQMARVFTWQRRNKNKPTSAKQIDSQPLEESDDEDHHHRTKK